MLEDRVGSGVAVIGHFALGTDRIDGQIYRTRLVAEELEVRLATSQVHRVDTARLRRRPVQTILRIVRAFRRSRDIVIMPGERGLRWLVPIYTELARLWRVRIHYLVVGGWLAGFLERFPRIRRDLGRCEGIYVQSKEMQIDLREIGLSRVHVLRNFRRFGPIPPPSSTPHGSLSCVFLSRVIPSKGVDLAIDAVQRVQERYPNCDLRLHVWGPIPEEHRRWFDGLMHDAKPEVSYHGVLDPRAIQKTLAQHDVMLFPTGYGGEGFPGVVIDAYSAGIPVVATRWRYAAEVIEDDRTGLIVESRDAENLAVAITRLLEEETLLRRLKSGARERAESYHVDAVIPSLLERMGLVQGREDGTAVVVGTGEAKKARRR